jgi:hypothetical protein
MQTSVRKIITGAMRLLGLVQANDVPTDVEIQLGIKTLNVMIDSWSNDRLMIFKLQPYYFQTAGGQQNYTLGPAGDWVVERPMRIEQAYTNLTSNQGNGLQTTSLPISMANDNQWSSIVTKYVQTQIPTILYDNGNYPTRTISLYPIPTGTIDIVLWLWQPLLTFANIDEMIEFPKGYVRCIRYNLAVELAPDYGKTASPLVTDTAINTKMNIATINAVPQYARMDPSLGQTRPTFNWLYGDQLPIPK